MGIEQPVAGKPENQTRAGVGGQVVFAQNTGRCVEDSYPEGSILLNLGCGDIHWDGWINVDAHVGGWKVAAKPDVEADITDLPFGDNYADVIVAIHVIEHFYKWEVPDVLEEWKRVLKPGGKLILELPSMEKVFSYIANAMDRKIPMSGTFSFLPLWGDPSFKDPAMMHKWGYFFAMLRQDLVKAGFDAVTLEKPRYHFPNRDMRVVAVKP